MTSTFKLTVNGKAQTVTTDPQRTLLDVLREELKLTGTKYGCGEGQCRACTVLLDGKPVASCVTPISQADKGSVLTIEGLAPGKELHPVQRAFLEQNAFQCGYCTPGMILETVAFLKESPRPSAAQIGAQMEKHLCRCCNYPSVVKAINRAAELGGK